MPFGKFKGHRLVDLDTWYLEWLTGQEWFGGKLKLVTVKILQGRENKPVAPRSKSKIRRDRRIANAGRRALAPQQSEAKVARIVNGDFVMPTGKYAGLQLRQIDVSYLKAQMVGVMALDRAARNKIEDYLYEKRYRA